MARCRFRKKCKYYDKDGCTCNQHCDRNYCGVYRELSGLRYAPKVLLIMLLGIFMISMTTAAEFDNGISDYYEGEEVITFKDGCILDICFGDVIGQVQLKTPKNFKVDAGYNYVWELDAWVYEDYNDFLKQFEYLDMKTEDEIDREIDIKILSYDLENKEVWKKVTPADLKKNEKVTLRGYTDVQAGDYVDWSPVIFGVRVSHDIWASWIEVDLISPADNFTSDETLNNFSCSAEAFNLTGILEGIINITNYTSSEQIYYNSITDISNSTFMTFNWTNVSLDNGEYLWECSANYGEFRSATILAKDTARDNHGVVTGNVIFNNTGGAFGDGAFEFDGDASSYIIPNNIINMNDTYSISSWIYTDDDGRNSIVGDSASTSGYLYLRDGTKDIAFEPTNNVDACIIEFDSYGSILGKWVNFIWVVSNSNNMSLYMDGDYIDSCSLTDNDSDFNIEYIGRGYRGLSSSDFNGSMGNIMLFNRALNQTEISSLNSSNTILNRSGLVAEYNMDEEFRQYIIEENVTIDQSGNGNNGTLNGGMELNESYVRWGYRGAGFDGVDDSIETSSNFIFQPNGTLSFWAKTNEIVNSGIFGIGAPTFSSSININYVDNTISMEEDDGTFFAFGNLNVQDNSWHHYVLRWFSNNTLLIY